MITIKKYFNPVLLSIDIERLEKASIECKTSNDFFNSSAIDINNGICLFVHEKDEAKAKEILNQNYSTITQIDNDEQIVIDNNSESTDSELTNSSEIDVNRNKVNKIIGIIVVLVFFGLLEFINYFFSARILYNFKFTDFKIITNNIYFIGKIFYVLAIITVLTIALYRGKDGVKKTIAFNRFSLFYLIPIFFLTTGLFFINGRISDFTQVYIFPKHFFVESRFTLLYQSKSIINFFIPIIIIAPIFEEVFYRGFILKRSMKFISKKSAILLSSILFGIMHLNPSRIITATIAGILFALFYLKIKSIYPCIFSHFVYNTLFTIFRLLYPQNYEEYQLTYTQLSSISIYDGIGIISFLLGLFIFLFYYKMKSLNKKKIVD